MFDCAVFFRFTAECAGFSCDFVAPTRLWRTDLHGLLKLFSLIKEMEFHNISTATKDCDCVMYLKKKKKRLH